jgi:hypothetical protein
MIDARGRELYTEITTTMTEEEDHISLRLGLAMNRFDGYMNWLNKTTGMMYDKHGNAIMKYDDESPCLGYKPK